RRACSLIKGGRLAQRLAPRPGLALLISDVEGDDPAIIGSGPLTPSADAAVTADELPENLQRLLAPEAAPQPGEAGFDHIDLEIVASNAQALAAAAERAHALGLEVHQHPGFLHGEAAELGAALAQQLLQGPPGIHLWGGEPTVTLPAQP